MNAIYSKVAVDLMHNGQLRECHLHVVEQGGKEALFFLFDFYGWAIDDHTKLNQAANLFATGKYRKLE
jgi:hypothetical protein